MESNCTRCQGLIVWDFDQSLGQMATRCVSCGHRPMNPPPREPDVHHLTKPRVGDLHTCRCGQPKVEWRMYCRICSNKKLNKEQRRKLRERNGTVKRKEVQA